MQNWLGREEKRVTCVYFSLVIANAVKAWCVSHFCDAISDIQQFAYYSKSQGNTFESLAVTIWQNNNAGYKWHLNLHCGARSTCMNIEATLLWALKAYSTNLVVWCNHKYITRQYVSVNTNRRQVHPAFGTLVYFQCVE